MKHKWCDEIVAWANGAEIESKDPLDKDDPWVLDPNPNWLECNEYRIKPQPKEPQYVYVFRSINGISLATEWHDGPGFPLLGKIKLEVEDEAN